MYKKQFLSIIIATFNAASDLQRTLDSFSSLSEHVHIEIIIQDGGSTDNTCAVAESFSQRLSISIESKKDAGIYDAWNKALERVSGEWVLFMGAGDTFCSQHSLSEILNTLQTLPTACRFYSVPVVSVFAPHEILETIRAAEHPLQELPHGMCLPHQGLFHRRELFDTQKFNTRFRIAGDYDFVCRTLTANNFCKGKKACVYMLFGGISSDMGHMLRREKEFWHISRHYFPHSFPWKIFARAVRCTVHRMVSRLAGEHIAGIVSDFPRRLQGKPVLWSRQRSPIALPSLPASPLISLLIATLHRREELALLLHSLRSQSYKNFQIVIADQNEAAYLDNIFIEFSDLPLTRVLLPSKGVSTARNALLPLATGDIIAFPDDDCWYAKNTLEQVVQGFQRFPNAGGLLGVWAPDDKQIRQLNFCEKALGQKECFHMGGTCVQFFRKELVDQVGAFDEKLGPGTTYPYGCGEDTDFLLRVHQKSPIIRIPSIHVYHPAAIAAHSKRKIQSYAAGRMYLLKKHHFSYLFQLGNVLFPLVQIPKALLLGDIHSVCYRWAMFCGRLKSLIR